MCKEKLYKLCLAERVGCMYKGSIKIKELEEEIGKEKMAKFKEKVWLEFGKKKKYIFILWNIYDSGQIYRSICRKNRKLFIEYSVV